MSRLTGQITHTCFLVATFLKVGRNIRSMRHEYSTGYDISARITFQHASNVKCCRCLLLGDVFRVGRVPLASLWVGRLEPLISGPPHFPFVLSAELTTGSTPWVNVPEADNPLRRRHIGKLHHAAYVPGVSISKKPSIACVQLRHQRVSRLFSLV